MPTPERPTRVAMDGHVLGRQQTGNETYLVTLARGLAARHDIDLTVYVDAGAEWPGEAPGPRLAMLRSRRRLIRIPIELPIRTARQSADLLHVQYVAPPVIRIPVVTAVHDVSFEDEPEQFSRPMRWQLRAAVALTLRRSAVVVTPSAFTRDRLLHHFDYDDARVVVTPIGIEAAPPPPGAAETAEIVARLRLPTCYALFVGQFTRRKNIPRLIEAIALIRASGTEMGLVLAGRRAWGASEVDAAIERHGAQNWVRVLGHVDDAALRTLYATAAVVAYPSLYEGFGLPVLEAMAAGAPVVAADRAAVPEVAGGAALLVDPTDARAIGDALAMIATDVSLRSRLIAEGRTRAALFTVERFAATTVEGYRIALER